MPIFLFALLHATKYTKTLLNVSEVILNSSLYYTMAITTKYHGRSGFDRDGDVSIFFKLITKSKW